MLNTLALAVEMSRLAGLATVGVNVPSWAGATGRCFSSVVLLVHSVYAPIKPPASVGTELLDQMTLTAERRPATTSPPPTVTDSDTDRRTD